MKTAGALINRGIVSARFCYITAFVIFVFTAFCTSTEASSYDKGNIGCDVTVESTESWSGIWLSFTVKFYAKSATDTSTSYGCRKNNVNNSEFFCRSTDLKYSKNIHSTLNTGTNIIPISITPGTINAQYKACKQLDDYLEIKLFF